MTFVAAHVAALAVWIGWNTLLEERLRFDPYPFGLLTFIVSLLAEQEMTLMLKMLRQISERLNVAPESEDAARATKLTEETNVYDLVETLKREMPEKQ